MVASRAPVPELVSRKRSFSVSKNALTRLVTLADQFSELGAAVVDHRMGTRLEHLWGDRSRAGDT